MSEKTTVTEKVTTITSKQKTLLIICTLIGVIAIIATSVFATVAYLTSAQSVTNTFTVGNVKISMTESKVNTDGTLYDEGATKVTSNEYHLIPNMTYVKDPVITVDANSEDAYLFIVVTNGIADIEDPAKDTIAAQLAANEWTQYATGSDGAIVYVWKNGTAVTAGETCPVFTSFSINPVKTSDEMSAYQDAKVIIKAGAIQTAGFDSIDNAWSALIAANPELITVSNSND